MSRSTPWGLLSPDGKFFKLVEPNFFIGRAEDLDLTLKSRSVDKRHAVITANVSRNLYQLHDLGSLNGTFVNEARVRQAVTLGLRDNIRFGYVSCEDQVIYGPKWIAVEEANTLSDLLRCATGDKYRNRKFRIVVSSEKSLKDFSFVKLGLPVKVLDKNDKKIVSFLLKPDESTFITSNNVDNGSIAHAKPAIGYGTGHLNATNQPLTYQGIHQHAQPYSPYNYSVSPDAYTLSPVFHHSPAVTCSCPSCIGPMGLHPPLSSSPSNYSPHLQHGFHGYLGWSHGMPPLVHSSHGPRMPDRPISVHGDRSEIMAKGSPLYGQPPWWGWGSDDEVYTYPHTSSFTEGDENSTGVTSQQTVLLRKKKLLTKKDSVELAQKRHTVAVLSESKEQIYTRTAEMLYETKCKKESGEQRECVVYGKNPALPIGTYNDQLSPVFEHCTSADWETAGSVRQRDQLFGNDEGGTVVDDSSEEGSLSKLRNSLTYEIPIIPDYGEIPDKPVSEKRDRKVSDKREDSKISARHTEEGNSKRKVASRLKRRPGVEKSGRNAKSAVKTKGSTSSAASDTTSESECEVSAHRMKRRSGATTVKPTNRVFGLTEVSVERVENSDGREMLSPAPSLPNWVQQRNRVPGASEVMLVSGSSSAAEDSLNSSMTSTGSFMSGSQPDSSEAGRNSVKEPTRNSSEPSRPRSASARASSGTTGVIRSNSLSSPAASRASSSKTSPPTVKISRSKTMTASLRRSYPSTGNDVGTKSPRSRSVSSVSDESEENDKRGEQFVPEKEGKGGSSRQLSGPVSTPRGNKTAMLRAQNSREVAKSALKGKLAPVVRPRSPKPPSPSTNAPSGNNASPSPTIKRSAKSPGEQRTSKSFDFSMTKEESKGQTNGSLNNSNDSTQEAVNEMFRSAGRSSSLPESLQMKRDDPVNRTFVLDDGKQQDSLSLSGSERSIPNSPEEVSSTQTTPDITTRLQLSDHTPPDSDAEGGKQGNSRVQHRLIPFSSLSPTRAFPPPISDKPFTPPSGSPDEKSFLATGEGQDRLGSPKSVFSLSPTKSPSPPPSVKALEVKGQGSSQARRQWDVTDKPVEDLMLSSIHAFSVELRLASESVLSKVKGLYEGGEEFPGNPRPRSNSESKQEPQSAIPDWKSSHAEIAGIFRNLRKVELRLRTMDEALSIMYQSAVKQEPKEIKDRRFSMVEMPRLGTQNWRDFKIKARRNSWAIEHRNQFPVPPESEEEEEDDSP